MRAQVYGDTDSVMIKFGYSLASAPDDAENQEKWMIEQSMKAAIEVRAAELIPRPACRGIVYAAEFFAAATCRRVGRRPLGRSELHTA